MLIVHYAAKTDPGAATATSVGLQRKILDPAEPVPPGAVWIDMIEPTVDEDRKVEGYLGSKVPSRSDPDFAQPAESYYAENGVRYLHACVVSEAEGTPDVADVTFVLGPKALVTVRYDPGEAFELFGQRLGKIPTQALHPDAVAVGLINAIIDRSARALNKVGVELDSIACQVFRAKGDQSARSKIYSGTLGALGREDQKISNLRESLVELERLVLFLMSEGRSASSQLYINELTEVPWSGPQNSPQIKQPKLTRSAKLLPPRPYNPASLALECLVRHVDPLVHPRRLEQRLELRLRQAVEEPRALQHARRPARSLSSSADQHAEGLRESYSDVIP